MLHGYVSISLSLSDIRGGSSITKTRHYLTLAVLIVFQFAAASDETGLLESLSRIKAAP
ncbi:MAG: hypothetical protein HQK97_06045 [Nitrospirae bacterium]|nr:hypothetical protein [Nitrospirota bacterium]